MERTAFQAPLSEDWVVTVDKLDYKPYADGQQDFNDNVPCTAFRHYSTCEEWYQYVTGYVAAKLFDTWAQAEADDLEDGMDEVEWQRRGC